MCVCMCVCGLSGYSAVLSGTYKQRHTTIHGVNNGGNMDVCVM